MRIVIFFQMFWTTLVLFLTLESIDLIDNAEKPYLSYASWINTMIVLATGFFLVVFYLLKWKQSYKFVSFFATAFAGWSIWLMAQSNYLAFSTEWWEWGMMMIHFPAILAFIISIFVKPLRKRKYVIYPFHFIMNEGIR